MDSTARTKPEIDVALKVEAAERAGEEAALLDRVSKGDRESFDELHRRLSTLLFSSALGILNNREAAEDVTQDVFVQIWEKAPSYDPGRGKAVTWALTLTRNKAIDRLRASQRRTRLHDQVESETNTEQHFDDRDSLHDALANERGSALHAALQKLPEEQRQAIQMAYFDDMPYPQVARLLGAPLGTIKARIRRGMLRLREILESKL
jgi:RNA polymerase sigma-70 factor, ECF subfamily